MARAVLFTGPGQQLNLVRFPTPEPLGAELLVRVTCCTLCRSDLHTHAGRRAEPTPIVLGHEIVGVIEAFGPAAPRHDAAGTPVSVGSRVTWAVAVGCGSCFFCGQDLPQKCERPYKYGHQRTSPQFPTGGGLSDFIVLVPETFWRKVPDEVADQVAAPANCATATVAAVLRHGGPVAGRNVLVLGGGVLGATACAMARAGGARAVMVSDPIPGCRQRAVHFGATHSFTADAEDLTVGVREVTDGRGADLVLELAGGAGSVETGIALARTGGTVVLAGTVAPVGNVTFDPEQVVRRMLTIRGVHNYHPRDLSAALEFLAGPGRDFPWRNLVVAEYPLEQAEQAFAEAHLRPGVRVAVVPETGT
ncbi:MAG: alcohol dehydrogenase catalytic domain-containing protein [Isosphaeraceae bacterium]